LRRSAMVPFSISPIFFNAFDGPEKLVSKQPSRTLDLGTDFIIVNNILFFFASGEDDAQHGKDWRC